MASAKQISVYHDGGKMLLSIVFFIAAVILSLLQRWGTLMPPSMLRAATTVAAAAYEDGNRLAAAGDLPAAERAYRRALAARPRFAEAWNNLGNVLSGGARWEEAAASYRAALECGLEHPLVHYNLGTTLRKLREQPVAAREFRHALAMRPDYAEAWNNLSNLRRDEKRFDLACRGYLRALRLRPDWDEAHDNLSAALYLLADAGQAATAREMAAQWRAAHPDHPLARHLGAALAGEAGDDRAADEYVRQVFDIFAADFDERLEELGYRAPQALTDALRSAGILADGAGLDVLDAGCGTGLCAPLLRAAAKRLDGVDLSEGMLARAAERGLYDGLHAAELTAFSLSHVGAYDLIVAADVLCYFGDLTAVLAAARGALRPTGVLAFSVERWERPESGRAYVLQTHGRYAHNESAVYAGLTAAGFELLLVEITTLRLESGKPVEGLIVLARRSA